MVTPLGWALGLVAAISLATFVVFFGRLPVFRRTPVAALHALLLLQMPKAALALDNRLSSGRISRSLRRFGHCLMYDRHPTVVIFFLLILLGSQALYLPRVWPQLGPLTKLTAALAALLPYLFLFLACAADPGYVTAETLAPQLALYPYDYALFHPGPHCRTCRLPKPPRSKHCSICKRCVARADHHCVFINSCVGYGNQHWFLLLLLSTALMTTYGSFLGISLLAAMARMHHPRWSLWPPRGLPWRHYFAVWSWIMRHEVPLSATSLLALLTSPLVWGLLLYSLYLLYAGTTTNESLKWSLLREDMDAGCVFRRALPAPSPSRDSAKTKRPLPGEPVVSRRWPVQPAHIVVTTSDGRPPAPNLAIPGQGDWHPVWSLKDIENIYDLGFWDNLLDVFIRHYSFGT